MPRLRTYSLLLAALTACTKPNPKNCSDGSCTDPTLPFCDVDGSLSGEANTCIAVACTPDQFAACRGDLAVTCNAEGNNYDEITCDKGCDPNVGCRVCDPNQTVCANGMVQTCDANGSVTSSTSCPLGCFEDQPRCRDINPSNGLAKFLDMVTNPQDLDLSTTGGQLDTSSGTVTVVVGGVPMSLAVPNFLASQPNGLAIRVFVGRRVRLGDVAVIGEPALAILATDELSVEGTLSVGAGSFSSATCNGGNGSEDDSGEPGTPVQEGASGGGANATKGGRGGGVNNGNAAGGAGGTVTGTQALVPLQGGCSSGTIVANGDSVGGFASGGGAAQLASRVAITVTGTIDARGGDGYEEQASTRGGAIYGGGAGGSVLLEAPTVSLAASAKVVASGGSGDGCSVSNQFCGAGGAGATVDTPAVDGQDANFTNGQTFMSAGGGGGGLGRERVNTPDRTYQRTNTTVETADVSTGTLSTR